MIQIFKLSLHVLIFSCLIQINIKNLIFLKFIKFKEPHISNIILIY